MNPSIAATVLAKLIRSSPEWKKGMVVMLLGCNSGADPSAAINPKIKKMYVNYASLAQRVADELGSPVEGASSFAWYHSNGYLPTVAPDANGTDWSTYKHGQSLKQSDREQGYINFKPRNIQNY